MRAVCEAGLMADQGARRLGAAGSACPSRPRSAWCPATCSARSSSPSRSAGADSIGSSVASSEPGPGSRTVMPGSSAAGSRRATHVGDAGRVVARPRGGGRRAITSDEELARRLTAIGVAALSGRPRSAGAHLVAEYPTGLHVDFRFPVAASGTRRADQLSRRPQRARRVEGKWATRRIDSQRHGRGPPGREHGVAFPQAKELPDRRIPDGAGHPSARDPGDARGP